MPSRHSTAATFEDLLALVRRLLGEGGCPWDRAQTPASLLPYLLEEAYEVREAVLVGDDAELARELGDLSLHVAFQSVLADERGAFDAAAVFRGVLEKMVRRHPHVFGPGATWPLKPGEPDAARPGTEPREEAGAEQPGPAEAPPSRLGEAQPPERPAARDVPLQWEELKRRERAKVAAPGRLLEGIPLALPALLKAQRIQERAASVGFDWSEARSALEKLREEVDELALQLGRADPAAVAEELGDLLFAAVNVSRKAGLAAEDALERANAKFRRRFEEVERLATERGLEIAEAGLEKLDALWDEVKRRERRERDGGTA